MAGIGHRGFMGRNKGVIPVPEAGVCTVYPIPIPVTSGLIHYSSPFNWCDQYNDLAGTEPLFPITGRWRNSKDISGLGNDQLPFNNLDTRRLSYVDNGVGDVYWTGGAVGGNTTFTQVNNSFVLGGNVKTIIILLNPLSIDPSSVGANKAIGFHAGSGGESYLRIRLGKFQIFDGSWRDSIFSPLENQYECFSVRCDSTITLGYGNEYDEVKASPIRSCLGELTLMGAETFNQTWEGLIRDVAIYNNELSDADVDTMVEYMKAKWNL